MEIQLRKKNPTGIQKGKTHNAPLRPNGKKIIGRPEKYSDYVASHICKELAMGRTLTSVCRDDQGMPCIATVLAWKTPKDKRFNQEFLDMYTLAREAQAEVLADMCDDIANDGRNDTYVKLDEKTGKPTRMVDYDVLARSALRIKTKQWNAKYMLPRKYGDKSNVELTGKDGTPLSLLPPVLQVIGVTHEDVRKEKEKNGNS